MLCYTGVDDEEVQENVTPVSESSNKGRAIGHQILTLLCGHILLS